MLLSFRPFFWRVLVCCFFVFLFSKKQICCKSVGEKNGLQHLIFSVYSPVGGN
jgi:hypothetical protein